MRLSLTQSFNNFFGVLYIWSGGLLFSYRYSIINILYIGVSFCISSTTASNLQINRSCGSIVLSFVRFSFIFRGIVSLMKIEFVFGPLCGTKVAYQFDIALNHLTGSRVEHWIASMLLSSAPLLKTISMGTVGERSGVFGFTMSAGLASFYRNSILEALWAPRSGSLTKWVHTYREISMKTFLRRNVHECLVCLEETQTAKTRFCLGFPL